MALTISADSLSLSEGGSLAFSVAVTTGDEEALHKPLSWVLLDAHGNVASHGDFECASGEVPPAEPGETSRGFAIAVFADSLFEGAEGYTVQIRSGGTSGDPLSGAVEASAGFTVEDGDAAPTYGICDAGPVVEGGELVFAVYADVASADEQTVCYRVDGGEERTLVFPAGATVAEIRVPTQDNADRADNPAVVVELLHSSVGTAMGTATGFVDDDEYVSAYSVSDSAVAVEGGKLAFTVTRTGRMDAETVTYGFGDGTATAGIDHARRACSVTFEAGEASKTILVQTFLDNALEPTETVSLVLQSASCGGVIENGTATGTIADLALHETLRRQVEIEAGPCGNVYPETEALRFADGWMAFDGGTDLGSAFRLYQAALGRAPDPIGLGFWTTALETGTLSLPEVAQGFVGSPEFRDRFGVPEHGGFVDLLYRHVLGREADAEGSAFWTAKLDAGAITRAEATLCFSESTELREAMESRFDAGMWAPDTVAVDVVRYFATVLDRLPDAGGLAFWIDARQDGMTLSELADAFTGAAEFDERYGALSNEGFVEQLYRNALDREGEEEGCAHWIVGLDSGGLTRADVVKGFAFSLEMTCKLSPSAEDGLMFV